MEGSAPHYPSHRSTWSVAVWRSLVCCFMGTATEKEYGNLSKYSWHLCSRKLRPFEPKSWGKNTIHNRALSVFLAFKEGFFNNDKSCPSTKRTHEFYRKKGIYYPTPAETYLHRCRLFLCGCFLWSSSFLSALIVLEEVHREVWPTKRGSFCCSSHFPLSKQHRLTQVCLIFSFHFYTMGCICVTALNCE